MHGSRRLLGNSLFLCVHKAKGNYKSRTLSVQEFYPRKAFSPFGVSLITKEQSHSHGPGLPSLGRVLKILQRISVYSIDIEVDREQKIYSLLSLVLTSWHSEIFIALQFLKIRVLPRETEHSQIRQILKQRWQNSPMGVQQKSE